MPHINRNPPSGCPNSASWWRSWRPNPPSAGSWSRSSSQPGARNNSCICRATSWACVRGSLVVAKICRTSSMNVSTVYVAAGVMPVSSLRDVSALSHSMAVEGHGVKHSPTPHMTFPQGEFQVGLARDGLLFSHSLWALHPLRRSPSEMVMRVQQSYDGWSLPRHCIGPPVHHTHG